MIAYSHFNQLAMSMFMIILSSRQMKRTLKGISIEKNDEPHVSHRDREEILSICSCVIASTDEGREWATVNKIMFSLLFLCRNHCNDIDVCFLAPAAVAVIHCNVSYYESNEWVDNVFVVHNMRFQSMRWIEKIKIS